MTKRDSHRSKQQVPGTMAAEVMAAADEIRSLYELPAELEGSLYARGCATAQLAVRWGVPLEDVQRVRREDCGPDQVAMVRWNEYIARLQSLAG